MGLNGTLSTEISIGNQVVRETTVDAPFAFEQICLVVSMRNLNNTFYLLPRVVESYSKYDMPMMNAIKSRSSLSDEQHKEIDLLNLGLANHTI